MEADDLRTSKSKMLEARVKSLTEQLAKASGSRWLILYYALNVASHQLRRETMQPATEKRTGQSTEGSDLAGISKSEQGKSDPAYTKRTQPSIRVGFWSADALIIPASINDA